MAGHFTNPATKFEDLQLFVHELQVITVRIDCHWKCVRDHCACAVSRDPWVGGQKQLHFWNTRPRFAYSLYNFYWAPTTIKGRLLSSRPILKQFSGEKKIWLVEMGPENGGFGENGCPNLGYFFATPKRHFCAEPRRVTYFASKSVRASWR